MKPYIAIVHKDGASAYGITFPDAPGCFAAADDLDDLFSCASEALELWATGLAASGQAIPPARDFSAVSADPEWRDSFADAVFVLAAPPPGQSPARRAA